MYQYMKMNYTKLEVTSKHEPSHRVQRKIAILRETSIERNLTKSVKSRMELSLAHWKASETDNFGEN